MLGPKLLSDDLIFFSHQDPSGHMSPCAAEPGLGNLSHALKCRCGAAQIPKAIAVCMGCLAVLPLSFVPHSSAWSRHSGINVKSDSHSTLHLGGNLSPLREAHGLIQLPDPPGPMGGQKTWEELQSHPGPVCFCMEARSYQGSNSNKPWELQGAQHCAAGRLGVFQQWSK